MRAVICWLCVIVISGCRQRLEPVPAPVPQDGAATAAGDVDATAPTTAPSRVADAASFAEVRFPEILQDGKPLRVKVEVVASEARITTGLMHRTFMPPDQGMLFLMGVTAVHSFWMHNTLIPLDMIFIDKDLTVVGIVANATPKTDTSRRVEQPSLYVLEVNGGWSAQHGVVAGRKVEFVDIERHAK